MRKLFQLLRQWRAGVNVEKEVLALLKDMGYKFLANVHEGCFTPDCYGLCWLVHKRPAGTCGGASLLDCSDPTRWLECMENR